MRPQKITFGDMREMGVRGVLIYCADYHCSHSVALSADRWPDEVRPSDIEPRFTCTAFGHCDCGGPWSHQYLRAVGHRDPNAAGACCSVIWSMSPMKRCLAAFAIAVSLIAPVAHAGRIGAAHLRVRGAAM
jgi:hypothetical protein